MLPALYWATVILAGLVGALALAGAFMQVSRDRQNRHRIACYQDWETRLTDFLFKGTHEHGSFGAVPRADHWLFRDFLSRYQSTFAGLEADLLRQLYLDLGIHLSLPRRLQSRQPRGRAQAALEIGAFRLDEPAEHGPPPLAEQPDRQPHQRLHGYLDLVLPLLEDPVPFVAHAAARALAHSRDLGHAAPVLAWIERQNLYQRERQLRVLAGFGPDLLPWMENHLEPPERRPEPWILFALLVGSHRHRASQPRLIALLEIPQVDLRVSALKALIILADPTVYPEVLPFASDPAWEIRTQAARALGVLGGPSAIPELLRLMADPVYEARRNAAQSLVDLGHAGVSALTYVADDPAADRFARDIARERLEWADERGHP
jgi:hypothetical protein